jgi:hypothetical protein
MTQESEIVRALRHTCDGCNPTPCCEFEALGPEAAELIEQLQSEVKRWVDKHNQAALNFQQENAECRRLQEQLADEKDAHESTKLLRDSMYAEKDAQLAASQRRADAAVEDMKLIVDAVREAHCDETCCFACKFDCDTSITDSGCYANECPGFDTNECFEWRGAKEEME